MIQVPKTGITITNEATRQVVLGIVKHRTEG